MVKQAQHHVAKGEMKETILKDFFEEKINDHVLMSDLMYTTSSMGDITQFWIEDMPSVFRVTPSHLVKVCDSALSGNLQPGHLKVIGFCLQASETFEWDENTDEGGRVADMVSFISSQENNDELNTTNLMMLKELLLNGLNQVELTT